MNKLTELIKLAKKEYKKMSSFSHDWNHIQRVLNYAKLISKKEKANTKILFPAVILHDLGRIKKSKNHSKENKLILNLLKKTNYSKKETEQIISCIKEHSFDSIQKPKTLEAKILFDADKLDSLKEIGIARFFCLAGEQNWNLKKTIENAQKRIKHTQKTGFLTKTGKKISSTKTNKTIQFYKNFFNLLPETFINSFPK
jgi:uncharacterized protein